MRVTEIIKESKEAPLYHFTTVDGFNGILASDTLRGRKLTDKISAKTSIKPSISFTRDYSRDFIPGKFGAQALGFRVNQSKLAQHYKITPTVNKAPININDLPPNYKDIVDKMRKTGDYSLGRAFSVNGTSLVDIAKGTTQISSRFESEERVESESIPNFSQYITGIVIPNKKSNEDIISFLVNHFKGREGFETRNNILDSAIKLSVPIIYRRKEFDPKLVKSQVINFFQNRKTPA